MIIVSIYLTLGIVTVILHRSQILEVADELQWMISRSFVIYFTRLRIFILNPYYLVRWIYFEIVTMITVWSIKRSVIKILKRNNVDHKKYGL